MKNRLSELLVPFETVKLLFEVDFSESTFQSYDTTGQFSLNSYSTALCDLNKYPAPTYDQVRLWLEDKGFYIETLIDGTCNLPQFNENHIVTSDYICYRVFIYEIGKPYPKPYDDIGADSYFNIMNSAFLTCIQILKDRNKGLDINDI